MCKCQIGMGQSKFAAPLSLALSHLLGRLTKGFDWIRGREGKYPVENQIGIEKRNGEGKNWQPFPSRSLVYQMTPFFSAITLHHSKTASIIRPRGMTQNCVRKAISVRRGGQIGKMWSKFASPPSLAHVENNRFGMKRHKICVKSNQRVIPSLRIG